MTKPVELISNDPHARYNKVAGGYAAKLMNQKNAEIEDWIEDYNDQIIDINPTQDNLNNAFQKKLRENLSTNAYDAQNGNWTNISDKNVEYWDDKPLRFTKHEGTGTYLVEQQDEYGNWVAMGYTNKDVAYEYVNLINSSTQNPSDKKVDEKESGSTKQERPTENVQKQPSEVNDFKVETIYNTDIPPSVMEEFLNYSKNNPGLINPKNTPEYYNLSPMAQKLVNKEINVIHKTIIHECVDNKSDIVIPIGKILISKKRNFIAGDTLTYNEKKGIYQCGIYEFTPEEMKNLELKDQ